MMIRSARGTALGVALAILAALAAGQARATNAETPAAACARIYDAASCRCALEAIASTGDTSETPPVQLSARDAAAMAPSAGMSRRAAFDARDFAHVVQACMAPGRGAPAD